jgi:hypothetical protein
MRTTKQEELQEQERALAELPPFLARNAVYRDRLRMMKWFCGAVVSFSALVIGLQEMRFHGVLSRLSDRDVLVVPGAVDFMRVRPNLLPDSSVYYFAEYIAEQVGNFSHRTIEERSSRLGEFCVPQFFERYMTQVRRAFPEYRELQVTEVFEPKPPTKYNLVKDANGTPQYVVAVEGSLQRYASDTRLLTEEEVIVVTFRTTKIKPDKPWFFEVVDINRKSRRDYNHESDVRERLVHK